MEWKKVALYFFMLMFALVLIGSGNTGLLIPFGVIAYLLSRK